MTTYLVTFDRIGRSTPPPMTVQLDDPDDLGEHVTQYAAPYLAAYPGTVNATVCWEAEAGNVVVGRYIASEFTVQRAA